MAWPTCSQAEQGKAWAGHGTGQGRLEQTEKQNQETQTRGGAETLQGKVKQALHEVTMARTMQTLGDGGPERRQDNADSG